MNIIRKARHVQIYGRSGKGKTTYAERYLLSSHHDRVYIFDHQDEMWQRLGVPPIFDFDGLIEHAKNHRICCFDPGQNFAGFFEEAFDYFAELVLDLAKAANAQAMESLLFCDEVQKMQKPNAPSPAIKAALQTGRRNGLDTVLMSQQPNRVHSEMREQGTEFIFFNLIDQRSLVVPEEMGLDIEKISTLPDLHYLFYHPDSGDIREGKLIY